MAANVIKELIDSGIHFGHRCSRWNPKMKPYILTKRDSIHIIDPKETIKGLLAAKKFVSQIVASGKDVLVVGTKRQARKSVEESARKMGMHYVTDRWLGGTLTNFRTIRARLIRLEALEELEAGGKLAEQSKKEEARLRREMRKIKRNLEGIRNMTSLPGVIVVVDSKREVIALREARKLGIATIGLIDTDSDPDLVDIPIPGNDDAMRAIELITNELADAALVAKMQRTDKAEDPTEPEPKRRSRRAVMGRATNAAQTADAPAAAVAPAVASAVAPAPAPDPVAPAVAPAPAPDPVAPAVAPAPAPAPVAPAVAPAPAPAPVAPAVETPAPAEPDAPAEPKA